MARYVIHKESRSPDPNGSYNGPTWDSAAIRFLYQQYYDNEFRAMDIAKLLTQANPGSPFKVSSV